MRAIVGASLKFPYVVIALAAALLFFGVAELRTMRVDVFPEFAPPRVEVQTACLGLTAEEVEDFVTVPIEQAMAGLPGLETIRSSSVSQLSSIEMLFTSDSDLLKARQVVAEKMAAVAATLPTWAAPPVMIPPVSATSRVMKIGMTSDTVDLKDLSMTAYWEVRARLLRVPGVADVAIWGERLKMLQVQVDTERLTANNITLDDAMQATADAVHTGLLKFTEGGALIGTGGQIDTVNQRLTIRHVLPILSAQELGEVPVGKRPDGSPVALSDVADVVEEAQPLFGDAVVNAGPGLMLVVQKLPWGNTLQVTKDVKAALAEMQPGLAGVKFDTTIFQSARFINTAIHNLSHSLIIGCLLVVLILSLFLFSWRSALISVIAIPLSLISALLVLDWRGATINTMILAGLVIAVGVVVDDAIIDIENVVRRMRQARAEGTSVPLSKLILEASFEVRSAIIYATLIDVVTLIPVLFVKGLSGAFFRPLAISYGLAVLASMVVALTVTPALGLVLLGRSNIDRHESPLMAPLHRAYERVLAPIVRSPKPAFALMIVICGLGIAIGPALGQSLFPTFHERDLLMHWITAPGTSDAEEARIATAGGADLLKIDGVRSEGTHIGQAFNADEVNGVNFGENWVSMKDDADYDETFDSIEQAAANYPGLFSNVETYLNERISEVLSGNSDPIVVRIFGPDLIELRKQAEEVEQLMSEVPGVTEQNAALQDDIPQIHVEVKLEEAQRYGLKPGDVRRAAATLIAGEEVGDLFRDGKAYDVQVWSTAKTRSNLTDVQNLPIDTPSGTKVRLADVADVSIQPTANIVHHEQVSRSIDVSAQVDERDLGSVVRDIQQRLDKRGFPLGYHAEMLGEYQERQATEHRLALFAIGAAVVVFGLLWASFHSLRLALLSFITLPTALVGGIIPIYLFTDKTISLGALIGFFTILGIAARNKIMLVNHYQHLERYEGEKFGPHLIIRGASERLSPIMMTALATGLALVPLVIAGNLPGHEIEHPMAVVIVGGLVTSTLVNLFILPSLYQRFGRSKWVAEHTIEVDPPPAPAAG